MLKYVFLVNWKSLFCYICSKKKFHKWSTSDQRCCILFDSLLALLIEERTESSSIIYWVAVSDIPAHYSAYLLSFHSMCACQTVKIFLFSKFLFWLAEISGIWAGRFRIVICPLTYPICGCTPCKVAATYLRIFFFSFESNSLLLYKSIFILGVFYDSLPCNMPSWDLYARSFLLESLYSHVPIKF